MPLTLTCSMSGNAMGSVHDVKGRGSAASIALNRRQDNHHRKKTAREKVEIVKRKYLSPFRIKTGCVVAVRYRANGNRIRCMSRQPNGENVYETRPPSIPPNTPFSEVWADPQPGRDEGLSLVGSLIRCCFPKKLLEEGSSQTKPTTTTSRFLEGEIVAIPDYLYQYSRHRKLRKRRKSNGLRVHLLVDKSSLGKMPFLTRVDRDLDLSKRSHESEARIKGKNNIVVEVNLCHPSGMNLTIPEGVVEVRWVIRKRVLVKPIKLLRTTGEEETGNADNKHNGTIENGHVKATAKQPNGTIFFKQKNSSVKNQSAPRYLGTKIDSLPQQETNWRWKASRTFPTALTHAYPCDDLVISQLSYNFVGQVIRIQPQSQETLAVVTIKRLILPEQLPCGRSPSLDSNVVFEELVERTTPASDECNNICYSLPIEDLVMLSRGILDADETCTNASQDVNAPSHQLRLCLTKSYSWTNNFFVDKRDKSQDSKSLKQKSCSRCGCICGGSGFDGHWLCELCNNVMSGQFGLCREEVSSALEDQLAEFAIQPTCPTLVDSTGEGAKTVSSAFGATIAAVENLDPIDFAIHPGSLIPLEQTSSKPANRTKSAKTSTPNGKSSGTKSTPNGKLPGSTSPTLEKLENPTKSASPTITTAAVETEKTRKSFEEEIGCSRLLAYNSSSAKSLLERHQVEWNATESKKIVEKPRNIRSLPSETEKAEGQKEDNVFNRRTARAKQRRILRGIADIGVSFDALLGREQQLRFDRSSIHAWGVFADVDIKEGEMLVEYRGEIIGNAMAESREIEYEKANIGSDYMFRIDEHCVCDATKNGNVARFINASCDPNCCTKIISADGTKRIAIYTKRDISAGEELCYDYKFPIESDETKRIPCHCGANDCRRFMN